MSSVCTRGLRDQSSAPGAGLHDLRSDSVIMVMGDVCARGLRDQTHSEVWGNFGLTARLKKPGCPGWAWQPEACPNQNGELLSFCYNGNERE